MCWGRHLRRGVVGAAETRPPCPLGLGGAAAIPAYSGELLLPGRELGGWSPTSCCRPVRLLGQVHFFSSYFLFSRHYESSAKECERSEVFFHSAGVMRDPRKSTEGNLGTVRVATSGLRLMEITKGQKPTVSATRLRFSEAKPRRPCAAMPVLPVSVSTHNLPARLPPFVQLVNLPPDSPETFDCGIPDYPEPPGKKRLCPGICKVMNLKSRLTELAAPFNSGTLI